MAAHGRARARPALARRPLRRRRGPHGGVVLVLDRAPYFERGRALQELGEVLQEGHREEDAGRVLGRGGGGRGGGGSAGQEDAGGAREVIWAGVERGAGASSREALCEGYACCWVSGREV